MFRFTTTTLINNLTDHNGLNVISTGGTLGDTSDPAYFQIKRVGKFYENCVTKVTHKAYVAPVMATATFATGTLVSNTLYRIKLYIRLNGSNEAQYANDLVYKGKPVIEEFKWSNLATAVAQINASQVKFGNPYVKATAGINQIIITGLNKYQMFYQADLEKYIEPTATEPYGHWELVSAATTALNKPGFGTYDHILKDLRIPTVEQMRWGSPTANEMPIPGAQYDQFVVWMTVDRGILGTDAVGDNVTSTTCHVFYVIASAVDGFEDSLDHIGVTPEVIL